MVKTADVQSSSSARQRSQRNSSSFLQDGGFFFNQAKGNFLQTSSFLKGDPFFVQKKCSACAEKDKLQMAPQDHLAKPAYEFNSSLSGMPGIQPKLSFGKPGDHFEKEADATADRVVQEIAQVSGTSDTANSPAEPSSHHAAATPSVQAKCDCEHEEHYEEEQQPSDTPEVQKMPAFGGPADKPTDDIQAQTFFNLQKSNCGKANNNVEQLQLKAAQQKAADASFSSKLSRRKGSGFGLDNQTRSDMEGAFGADFRGVNIHTDQEAIQMSNEIGAHAFTHGSDIYFNQGKYNPGSKEGQHLLAHELTHTIQQGKSPEIQRRATQEEINSNQGSRPTTPDVQAYSWDEFVSDVSGVVEGVTDAGKALFDNAYAFARAIGGAVSLSGTRLIITVPRLDDICPTIPIRFNLPEISGELPFAIGVVPLGGVAAIYGMGSVTAGITPEISFQIGPCSIHGISIAVDPLAASVLQAVVPV